MREGWIQRLDDIHFFGIAISVPMPEPRALAAPGAVADVRLLSLVLIRQRWKTYIGGGDSGRPTWRETWSPEESTISRTSSE